MKSSKAYDGAIVRAPFLVVPFSWWMHDVLAQGSDQFVEELSLTFGTVLVMGHHVAPDLNLLAEFQLHRLNEF